MPFVLLALGVATTLAGLLLIGSGLSLRDGTFNTDVLTPGAIAIVGGLLLVGFDFLVRQLRRVERALAARPVPPLARQVETLTDTPIVAETAAVAPPIPPPIPSIDPQVGVATPAPSAVAHAQLEDTAFDRLQARRPAIARVENGRLAEAADASLALHETAGLEEQVVADVRSVAAAGRATNGVAGAARVMPRRDSLPRPTVPPVKPKVSVFNTFWPPAPQRGGQPPVPPRGGRTPSPTVEQTMPAEPVRAPPPLPEALAASAPVSVLKSGVVEGMAYTLYSDGSIEAQLPQGTLRFGSISALRSHIENAG
jgi:hypothetical protein